MLAARQIFGMLRHMVRPLHGRTAVAVRTKLAVFRVATRAQFLYASEAWTLRESDEVRRRRKEHIA